MARWKKSRRGRRRPGGGGTFLVTIPLPNAGPEVVEGHVPVDPERMDELMAAFDQANQRAPGDDHCPICALQRRWEEEDRQGARGA